MKLRFASLVVMAALAQSAFAADPVAMGPTVCPDVSTLAAVKLDNFMSDNNQWIGVNWSTKLAGSNFDWSVGAGLVTANTKEEAAVKLQNVLATATLSRGPVFGTSEADGKPMWSCEYKANDGNFVEAATPAQLFTELLPASGSSLFKKLEKCCAK